MDEAAIRRISMTMGAAAILGARMDPELPPNQAEINKAVALAADIDSAVARRIRWERRPGRPADAQAPAE